MLEDKDNTKKGGKRSIFYELRDNPTLPRSEKSALRLEQEATLLVMAGMLYPLFLNHIFYLVSLLTNE